MVRRNMKHLTFSPSLMCGDLLNLANDLRVLRKHSFDYVHLDIADGHFVPNITLGFDLVNDVQDIPRDIHLMVEHPQKSIQSLQLNQGDIVTIHVESKDDILATVHQIQSLGARAGLAVSPDTPTHVVYPLLKHIDQILVMTVYPGFAGRPFVASSYKKIEKLIDAITQEFPRVTVGVDGAIGFREIEAFSELGVTHFVLGTTALFKGDLDHQANLLTSLKFKLAQGPA